MDWCDARIAIAEGLGKTRNSAGTWKPIGLVSLMVGIRKTEFEKRIEKAPT
jgi:hypothetical protein